MKRLFLLSLFSVLAFSSFAQKLRIGLNFSPAIALSRLTQQTTDTAYSYSKKGAAIKFIAGPELSFYLGDNYAFTTGLWYVAKSAKVLVKDIYPQNGANSDSVATTNLQYIQLPATFKLFTNEIATDMKLYFQVGATADIKVGEKLKDVKIKTPGNFGVFDSSVLAGAGVELQMGSNTYFLAGLRYTRGLLNQAKNKGSFKDLSIKTDLISLDLGIRF